MKNYNKINSCEVCGNSNLSSVLDIGMHPMCDDLVPLGNPKVCKEYPIEILFCSVCKTAHQHFQVPKEDLFPTSYHYRSRFTADVLNGMQKLVESCSKRFGSLSGKKVLDIGCNDGSLLDFFNQEGAITFGIEPTEACLDAERKNHKTYKSFLSEDLANEFISDHGNPDFITFTNVFAHIEDLQGVLRALKILRTNKTIIVIENHYLGSVLDGNQFDTFYHEHPRTYSYGSFVYMAETLESKILDVEFPSRYGGNIRIYLGQDSNFKKSQDNKLKEISLNENSFFEKFSILNQNIENWKTHKKQLILNYVNKFGPLSAKAFPGRAAILVKLLELDHNLIDVVYEKPGSLKIGNYLPGTRIPIMSDNVLFENKNNKVAIINFAWHIPKEIRNYMHENKFYGEIIDVLTFQDFIQAKS